MFHPGNPNLLPILPASLPGYLPRCLKGWLPSRFHKRRVSQPLATILMFHTVLSSEWNSDPSECQLVTWHTEALDIHHSHITLPTWDGGWCKSHCIGQWCVAQYFTQNILPLLHMRIMSSHLPTRTWHTGRFNNTLITPQIPHSVIGLFVCFDYKTSGTLFYCCTYLRALLLSLSMPWHACM